MKNFDLENVDCHAALAMTKNVQSGRSMIEMLGVLAIIGVLSVGGIAGYSKAMMKYRINKTIEQITLIAGNMRTFYKNAKTDYSQNLTKSVVKKAKLLPEEMWVLDNQGNISEFSYPFGLFEFSWVNKYGYMMNLYDVPQEACIELATYDWRILGENLYSIGIEHEGDSHILTSVDTDCNSSTDNSSYILGCNSASATISLPLPLDKVSDVCNSDDDNNIAFILR